MKHGFLTAIKLAKLVAKAIQRDRSHLVRVNQDYFAGRFLPEVFGKPVPDYDCRDFWITDGELWIKCTPEGEEPQADGATLFPDRILGFDLAPAFIPHDHAYPWIDDMAQHPAWVAVGWDKKSLRALWDGVYGDIALYKANKLPRWHRVYARPVARGTYAGTRLFGGLARWVYSRTCIFLLVAGVATAASTGCIHRPPGIFAPSDDDPDYTIVPREAPPFFNSLFRWLDSKTY